MMKISFRVLLLFAFSCLTYYAVVLLFSKSNSSDMFQFYKAVTKKTTFLVRVEATQNVLAESAGLQQGSNDGQKMELAPGQMGPCPATPPGLVGPLLIEFPSERTMEDVKREVLPLKEGGKYNTTDCITQHKVAIIIPFRNRHEHLKHWLFYLHPILKRQHINYGVYVINQYGDGIFNRAKLLNAGFIEALKEDDYNCFVFSDVDLVPLDDRNLYRCFDQPRHLAVAMDKFEFNLPYHTFFGGVSSLSKEQFLNINGFPNTYWGWGGEDDDIYNRIIQRGMSISRPDLFTGRYKMIKHLRDKHNEANPVNVDKIQKTSWTMDQDGINTLTYKVIDTVKDATCTFITVDIDAPKD